MKIHRLKYYGNEFYRGTIYCNSNTSSKCLLAVGSWDKRIVTCKRCKKAMPSDLEIKEMKMELGLILSRFSKGCLLGVIK